jgi:Uma2 family endonuclease
VEILLPESVKMSDEQFFELCLANRDARIERDRFGVISVMSPVGSGSGYREAKIIQQLGTWADQDGTGIAFSSSAGFKLPNGADRAPDAAWVRLDRWNSLTTEQQERFAPLCPDFVVELRSASDALSPLQAKMQEYSEQPGFQLGLLIDRKNRDVYVYRQGVVIVRLTGVSEVDCGPELVGFVLRLDRVW